MFSGWNASGMKHMNPPVSSCNSRSRHMCSIRSARGLDVAVQQGRVRAQAVPWADAGHLEPAFGGIFFG